MPSLSIEVDFARGSGKSVCLEPSWRQLAGNAALDGAAEKHRSAWRDGGIRRILSPILWLTRSSARYSMELRRQGLLLGPVHRWVAGGR